MDRIPCCVLDVDDDAADDDDVDDAAADADLVDNEAVPDEDAGFTPKPKTLAVLQM